MHSEFACHIGLRGKYFCRICEVKGSDAADTGDIPIFDTSATPDNSPAPSPANSPTPSAAGSDYESDTEALVPPLASETPIPPMAPSKGRGRYRESMTAMFNRVKAFVKVYLHPFSANNGQLTLLSHVVRNTA